MFKKLVVIFFITLLLQLTSVFAMTNTGLLDEENWRPVVKNERSDIQESKYIIKEIKSREPFIDIQEEKIWSFEGENKDLDSSDSDNDTSWLSTLITFIAMLVEAFLWFLPIVIAFYLYRYREYWLDLIQNGRLKNKDQPLPETLFGLDIRQKSLPDDVEQVATQLWQKHKYREAVSLLYRGSLVALFKQYKFELPVGATEQDCIRQIEKSALQTGKNDHINQSQIVDANDRIAHFKQLTQIWIKIAYAHQMPDDSVFKNICDDWNKKFSSYNSSEKNMDENE